MAGFIYIMSNPAFLDGRLKIGISDRDPNLFRRVELETTGVPEAFRVEYYAFVDDPRSIEQVVHKKLDNNRPNKAREFFIIGIQEAVEIIRSSARLKFEECFFKDSPGRESKVAKVDKEQEGTTSREQYNSLRLERDRIIHEASVAIASYNYLILEHIDVHVQDQSLLHSLRDIVLVLPGITKMFTTEIAKGKLKKSLALFPPYEVKEVKDQIAPELSAKLYQSSRSSWEVVKAEFICSKYLESRRVASQLLIEKGIRIYKELPPAPSIVETV